MPALFFLLVVVGGYGAFLNADEATRTLVKQGAVALAFAFVLYKILAYLAEIVRAHGHTWRVDRLQAFANELPKGKLEGPGFYARGRTTVTGVLDERQFHVAFDFGSKPAIRWHVRLGEGARAVSARRPSFLWRLLLGEAPWRDYPRDLGGALRELLIEQGLDHVTVCGRALEAQGSLCDGNLELERLLGVWRNLVRVAKAVQPPQVARESRTASKTASGKETPMTSSLSPTEPSAPSNQMKDKMIQQARTTGFGAK
jgi:hypothetical protein